MSQPVPIDFEMAVVETLADYLSDLASFAEHSPWQDLYLETQQNLRDILAAWRQEVDL